MKKYLPLLLLLLCSLHTIAQKQNIDVDLLSNIISAKQDELKTRVLSNIVVRNIKTTNYTTYNTIYNLVDILTTEKNKTVMTKGLIHEMINYALVIGLTNYFIKKNVYQENGNGFLRTGSELGGDRSGSRKVDNVTDIIRQSYVYDTANLSEQTERKRNVPQQDETIWNNLLANYLIDTAFEVLSRNKTLTARGFFKKDPLRQFFNSGLPINYTEVRNHFRQNKPVLLNDFVSFLNTCTQVADNADSTIKFVENELNQVKDLSKQKISREQIAFIMYLFNESINNFREQIGQNNFIATIGDIITKYVIFDVREDDQEKVYDFKIDVEAIILAFEDKFYATAISNIRNHKIGVKPFFSIGLSYGYFTNQNNQFKFDNGTKNLTQIALAGERLGVKFIIADYKYTRAHSPLEWYRYKGVYRRWTNPMPRPLISKVYAMVYASGLLYNIVDLRSEDNFKYAITGTSFGVEFFNGLELNLGFAMPVIPKESYKQMLDKGFINFGFDIPIFEYLRAVRDKRNY